MDKQPVGQLPDLTQSNNDDEIMVITNSEYNQLKKEKISDLITDFTSTNENNALTKGTDGKMFVTDFGNASNITEGTLPVSVLPDIPKDKLPQIETDDLPDSGITAGTYTYPTDIVINSKGQVTSITEGQAGANNANQDLSNLGPLGLDKINQSKALETGSVSSDADVYADVLKYKNSGTGTGIDVIKPDNYEVVGSPTITEDGVVNNVPIGVSIKSLEAYSLASDFTIISPTITVNSFINNTSIDFCRWSSNFYLSIGTDFWVWSVIFVNKDGTKTLEQKKIQNISTELKKKYVVKFEQVYKDSKYIRTLKLYDSKDLLNPIGEYSYESIYPIYEETDNNKIEIVYSPNKVTDAIFDLNTCKFYQNGNLVYQPCLKIPYTESKTGSKIVDVAYRDRVQDLYEQTGEALFYTIDEENQDFTLPAGDIYGMIEKTNEAISENLNKTQITNCILSAPNGVATFSGSNITLKQGLKMLYPNGRNIDKTLKNGELTLDSDTILDLSAYSGQTFDFELMFGCNINASFLSQNYQESDIAPTTIYGSNQIYLNTVENQMYFYYSSTSSWVGKTLIKLGKGRLENGVIVSLTPYQPVELIKRTDPQIQAPYITETYKNGRSGYRIWSDGYCEQWGYTTFNAHGTTVTFPKKFIDTNYTLLCQINPGSGVHYGQTICVTAYNSSSFTANGGNTSSLQNKNGWWKACGYITV